MSEVSDAKATATHEQQPTTGATTEAVGTLGVPATAAGMPPTAQGYFAVVNSNGTLARGFGVVSSARLALGQYEVIFNHSLSRSAFVGTLGLAAFSGISPAGEIAVVGRATNSNGVFVQTFDSTGASADLGFHLQVMS